LTTSWLPRDGPGAGARRGPDRVDDGKQHQWSSGVSVVAPSRLSGATRSVPLDWAGIGLFYAAV